MRVVFVGLLFCEESLDRAKTDCKKGIQMATHLFQARLIEGFRKLDGVKVKTVCFPPIGSFPINYRKLFSKEYEGENFLQIGYLNLPVIKHRIQEKKLYKTLSDEVAEGEKTFFVVYSLFPPFVNTLNRIKAENPNIHVCLIQPDTVPGRNDAEEYMSRKTVKLGNRLVESCKNFDSFVVFSKYITNALEIGNRPYVVTECICNNSQKMNLSNCSGENIFLYTGSTGVSGNVEMLVDAFTFIQGAELWICGYGEGDDYISEVSKAHDNIKFFGFVSQNRVDELRDHCDYLINPRMPTGTYTKYSFPSKTAEYLMSGKPVVMYKLEAIPDEYDEYINYLHSDDAESLSKEIQEITKLDYDSLLKKASRAREYMIENKNEMSQAKRIIELMSSNS